MLSEERFNGYIRSLESNRCERLDRIEKEALENQVPIIKKPVQNLIRFLMGNHKPEQILEVGCAVGFSAILMSHYAGETARLTTIEKVPKRILKARENIEQAGMNSRITLLEGDAAVILAELPGEQRYDFVFMDAAKGQYMNFLPDVMRLLKTGGILMSDNVLQDGDLLESRYAVTRRDRTIHVRMREYLYELTHREDMETVILPLGDGVTLSTKCYRKGDGTL